MNTISLDEIKQQKIKEAEQFYKDFNVQQADTNIQTQSVIDLCPWLHIEDEIKTIKLSNSTTPMSCY